MKQLKRSVLYFLIWLVACTPQAEVIPTASPQPEIPPTAAEEVERQPVLRVAYSKQADPWVWTEGEGSRRVADSINVVNVVLSSDGQVVAFKRDDTGEVFSVSADGSNLHPLVSAEFLAEEALTVWDFKFAPNSHNIYFTLMPIGSEFRPRYDLYRVDADAVEPTPSMVRATSQGGIATFSPDGQWMTLYHPGGLELARADGSEAHTIFTYPEGYEPATLGPEIVWRQDSSGFSLYYSDVINSPESGAIWFVPTTGDPVQGTPIASPAATVSPDGQSAGYTAPNGEIHIITPDGRDSIYMTVENGSFGGWLPDSQHFVVIFEIEVEGFYGLANQYFLGAPGKELVPLTDTVDAYPVVWVSAGRFLFASLGELRIQHIGEPSLLLDNEIYNALDYVWFIP